MRRTARALAAACQTALLLAAPPLALTRLVGRPGRVHLPDPVGPADPQQLHQLIIASAGLLSWLAWATIAVALLLRAGRRLAVALRRLPRLRLPGPLQGLSAAVLGTVTVTTAAPAAAHATAATSPTVLPPPTRAIPAAAALPAAAAPGRAGAGGQHASYTVRRGDTLWHIAGDWLGNPLRWPDIYQLNRAHYDQHGRMRHGDHIEPGWVLVLPDGATPPAGAAPAPPPAQPSPMQPQPPAPAPSRVPAPSMSASPSPSGSPSASTGQPDDPGAVAAPGFTGTATAAASPGPTATNASPPSRSPRTNPPGISLPGGSWVDLGLAAAIAAAAALVWIQRRRRYVPGPPSPTLRLDDPDLAPMPPVVTNVRRGLRRAAHGDAGLDLLEHAQPADADAPLGEPDVHDFGLYDPELDLDGQDAVGHDSAELDEGLQGDAEVPDEAPAPDRDLVPETPALDHALLQVWPPAGLGLTGPGGEAAVRGFLVAALAADGLDEPEARSRVVISAATLATLLGTEAVQVADTPRLTVTAGLPEALELLEAATLRRTRLADEHEVDTVAALRDADPLEEPLPPLLLIADATAVHQRARIASLLTQGQRLDIHGVLLGGWADGNIVHVAADGTTSRVDGGYGSGGRHRAHPADVGRLAVVDPTETADLLRTLAEAHTGQRQPAPPVEAVSPAVRPAVGTRNDEKATSARPDPADPTSEPIRADEKTLTGPGESPPADATDGEAIGDLAPARARAPASGLTPAHTVVDAVVDAMEPPRADRPGEPAGGLAEPVAAAPAGRGAPGGLGRAAVFLLGPPRIDNLPAPSRTDPVLRPQAMELLVYLVTHGGSAGKDQILEDVLGDAPASKAAGRLSTFVYSLRRGLKKSAGEAQRTYVGAQEDHYALNRGGIDIDLWRMQDAITAADTATHPGRRIAALREAVACYTGPLAEGKTYEWIEPYREAVRQQAVDAHLALVAELSQADPAEAVAVLTAAIGHDPYNDALYQQAMRLHARLGDIDAIRGLRKALTRRLGEIDAEPSVDTIALADQLITDLQHRPRAPRPVRGDAA